MAKIQKTTDAERQAIIRRSVLQLADRPSEHGQKPSDIKNAIAMPVFGEQNSALAVLDRVVDDVNSEFSGIDEEMHGSSGQDPTLETGSASIVGAINELRSKLTSAEPGAYSSLPTTAQTALEAIAELDNVKATKEALTTAVSDLESSIVGMGTSQQLYTDEAEASAKRYTDEKVQAGVIQANDFSTRLYDLLDGNKVDKTDYNANKGVTDHRLDSLENDVSTLKNSTIHICGYGEYDQVTKVPTIQNPNPHVVYLVPGGVSTQTSGNLYTEYRWVDGEFGFWERIGTAEFDLSQYYTKAEIETLLNGTRHVCTTNEVDASGKPLITNPNQYTTYLVKRQVWYDETVPDNYYVEWMWVPPIGTESAKWESIGMIPEDLAFYARTDVEETFTRDVYFQDNIHVDGDILDVSGNPYLNASDSATLSEMDEIFAVLS